MGEEGQVMTDEKRDDETVPIMVQLHSPDSGAVGDPVDVDLVVRDGQAENAETVVFPNVPSSGVIDGALVSGPNGAFVVDFAQPDDELLKMKREADALPVCSLTSDELDVMVEAVCAERDRRAALPVDLTACACRGPHPHCRCALRAMRQDIAAAWAALDKARR